MYKYLLPGSELHDKLRQINSNMDSTVVTVTFDYTDNVEPLVKGLESLPVAHDNSDSILASFSEDGTSLYVYSDYDIRALDCQMMFYRMSSLCRVKFNNFNTDECSSMRRMFMGCSSLVFVDMSNLSSPVVEDFTEMFSGCSSCLSVDVSNFQVPSTKETCVFSDMFKNTSSLRRISVGDKFTFNPSMSLSNPDISAIKESDGKWHLPCAEKAYNASELSGGVKGTYYACNVLDSSKDSSLITLGSLKKSIEQVAVEVSKKFKYFSL